MFSLNTSLRACICIVFRSLERKTKYLHLRHMQHCQVLHLCFLEFFLIKSSVQPAGDTTLFSHFMDNKQTKNPTKQKSPQTTTATTATAKKLLAPNCYEICLGKTVLGFVHGFLNTESTLVTNDHSGGVSICFCVEQP